MLRNDIIGIPFTVIMGVDAAQHRYHIKTTAQLSARVYKKSRNFFPAFLKKRDKIYFKIALEITTR